MADSDYDVTIIDRLTAPLSALLDSADTHLRKAVAGLLVRTAVPFAECRDKKKLLRLAPDSAAGQAREYAPVIDSISSSLEPCLKMDDVEARKRIARRLLEAGIAVLPEQNSSLCDRIAMIALQYPACAKKRRVTGQKTSHVPIKQEPPVQQPAPPAAPALTQAPAPVVPALDILPQSPEISCPAVPEPSEAQEGPEAGRLAVKEGVVHKNVRGYNPTLTNAFIEILVSRYSVPESDAIKEANTLVRTHYKDSALRGCFSPVNKSFLSVQVADKERLESRICELIDEYVRKMGPINEAQLQAALNYFGGESEEGQHSGKLATFYEFVHNAFSEHCRPGASIAADAFLYTKEWLKRGEIKACLNGESVTKPKELKELLALLVIDVQSKNLAGYLKKSDFKGRLFTIDEIRQLLGTNNLDQYRKHFGLLGEPRCPQPRTGFSAGYCGENVYNFLVMVGAGLRKSPQPAAD